MGLITGELIGETLGAVAGVISDLHSSPEERANAVATLQKMQNEVPLAIINAEAQAMDARARIAIADSASESALTRLWRPIVMLSFTALIIYVIIGSSAGLPTEGMLAAMKSMPEQWFSVLMVGLGVIGGGRSLEKTAKTLMNGKLPELPFKTPGSKMDAKQQKTRLKLIRRLTKKKNKTPEEMDLLADLLGGGDE